MKSTAWSDSNSVTKYLDVTPPRPPSPGDVFAVFAVAFFVAALLIYVLRSLL